MAKYVAPLRAGMLRRIAYRPVSKNQIIAEIDALIFAAAVQGEIFTNIPEHLTYRDESGEPDWHKGPFGKVLNHYSRHGFIPDHDRSVAPRGIRLLW